MGTGRPGRPQNVQQKVQLNKDIINSSDESENISLDTNTINTLITPLEQQLQSIKVQLENLESIKFSLNDLPMNIRGRVYYDNEIFPYLDTLSRLSLIVQNLSYAAINLSNIASAKNSKVKETLRIIYEMIDQCDSLYHVVECKIEALKKIGKCK